ncbi:hypothetical protein V6N13_125443 [Hibiscus sabdariffa]|uniref:Uncharacterized protein n=1 Tax=Hibiscus sabdariffa TaxID=183260 RepID=A0ABR2U5N2_9ROSI
MGVVPGAGHMSYSNKKSCKGETGKFNGGIFNQFGQIFPGKEADFHGWNLENNQNYTNGKMKGVSARAARSAYAYAAATGGQMNNINETAMCCSCSDHTI